MSMPLPKQLEPTECKTSIQNPNGTDSTELNQHFYNSSLNYFDRLSFQVQIEKKQTSFTVTNLNTVLIGVFNYQTNNYDWNTSIESIQSRVAKMIEINLMIKIVGH